MKILIRSTVWLVVLLQLLACAHRVEQQLSYRQLPPLQLPQQQVLPEDALSTIVDDPILALTPSMLEFSDFYINRTMSASQRVHILNRLIRSPAFLGLEYHRDHTYTAARAFDQASGNCLGFANLYIALARHYGLDARYQLVTHMPQWGREGNQLTLAIHVNVRVKIKYGHHYTVDITPRTGPPAQRSHIISDRQAAALYYNNLALATPIEIAPVKNFSLLVKSLSLSPDTDFLWANIGTLYRRAGQWQEAADIYQQALRLNPQSFTALNNLAVLYQHSGDAEKSAFYLDKIRRQRSNNPYYHFALAQLSFREGDYDSALGQVERAIAIKPGAAEFYYQQSRIYFEQGNYRLSIHSVRQAIERAGEAPSPEYLNHYQHLQSLQGLALSSR